jgi:hypothetical protein
VLASIEIAKHTLLVGGVILALGTTGLFAQKAKIPDVAVFPIVGMAIGPHEGKSVHRATSCGSVLTQGKCSWTSPFLL